jgi:hypothetical protein
MPSIDLTVKPDEHVLFCIAPSLALFYGILPVSLSGNDTLHVVSEKRLPKSTLTQLCKDVSCHRIVIDKVISPDDFEEAYHVFYKGLI